MASSSNDKNNTPDKSLGPILGPIQCPQCNEQSLIHLTGVERLQCLKCDFSETLSKPKPKPSSGPVGGLGMFLGACLVAALLNNSLQKEAQPPYQPQLGEPPVSLVLPQVVAREAAPGVRGAADA